MKRIVTLLLAAGLVMGAYTGAQAADLKISGKWNFGFHMTDNLDYNDTNADDTFEAMQRLRLQMDIIASENLKGVIFFEIGSQTWGNQAQGGALEADGKVVKVKRSYIDWTAPNTDLKIRMGIQGLALPGAAFGSPLFDEDVAAVTMSYAFNDTFALTGAWARPFDNEYGTGVAADADDEMDIFALVAPITLDGHSITPYFVYSAIGKDSAYFASPVADNADAYWFGVAYSMTAFDPFTLDVDFLYGDLEVNKGAEVSGWMVDFKAAYALDLMTPALIGWYGSGDDKGDAGIVPSIGGAASWYPTSFGYPGSCYNYDSNIGQGPNGSWALGVELADISFMEDLSHVFRFVYMEGTNDKDLAASNKQGAIYLTEDDSAFEINFDTKYDIYENLAFILELGYINLDIDDRATADDSAYKATFNFVYSF